MQTLKQTWYEITQENGATLGTTQPENVLEIDGLYFKDLNKNGKLDKYEDWRLPIEERIDDLIRQMSIEDIAGLMLYSSHQAVSSQNDRFSKQFGGTYQGKSFAEYDGEISDLTDQQQDFLFRHRIRHFLLTRVDNAETAAKWSNNLQQQAEQTGLGIPVNISSDPRHSTKSDTEFNAGNGSDISKWPEQLGLAATFDPQIVEQFANIARIEYRALGITTALSPQIDLATEPRWMRFEGTFGESSELTAQFAKAYCDGFQTTPERQGWGELSVNTMVKHWPGGGTGEAGRDAHFGFGQYAVYPANNFNEHLVPFIDGAFKLEKGTQQASAVMPYYTISYNIDQTHHENVGNGFSRYIISDLLREKYQYEGVVCTDWNITHDAPEIHQFFSGKSWGVEQLTVIERHYKAILAGCDQFGGNNDIEPVLAAYKMGVEAFGETQFRQRFEQSAKRLLRNIMQVGLFENPYVDVEQSQRIVAQPDFLQQGFNAQLKSIILLKNKHTLPIQQGTKVFIPKNHYAKSKDWFGRDIDEYEQHPVPSTIVKQYFEQVEDVEHAEKIIFFIESPITSAYDKIQGYLPISLQYGAYRATHAREQAIAGIDRSYKDKTNIAANVQSVELIQKYAQQYPEKEIIVVLRMKNPTILHEIEPYVSAILVEFGVQKTAIFEILTGQHVPQARLPFQLPANMQTVEQQNEDVAFDMQCYQDELGNYYDFGFGLTHF
ncbi:MAG: glycoside hydrolase family 3 N-terminal domain-containing protein [Acinetobacter sp.]